MTDLAASAAPPPPNACAAMGIAVPATADLLGLAASGELGPRETFDLLAGLDLTTLHGESRVDAVQAFERLIHVLAGWQQHAIAAVADATAELGLCRDEARHEIGAALHLSPVTAGDRTETAVALRDRFPATLEAMCAGDVSWRQGANLVDVCTQVPPATAAAVEARVLPRMPHQTAAETRRAARDALVRLDPEAAAAKLEEAHQARRIERLTQADGTRSWWMPFTPDQERNLWDAATRRARALRAALRAADPDADLPDLDALRVDAVEHAILGHTVPSSGTPGDRTPAAGPGNRPMPKCSCGGAQTAAVVIDLPTLLGLADNPGQLTGYGAVPAGLARAMAADRDWVRWTTDPGTGHLLDRGAETYRPADRLRAFVIARDRHCGFPGCHRPARDCDCDHTIAYGLPDGRTVTINLGPLCRQHHNAKTHGRWRLDYDPTTRVKTWTSPLGKTYTQGTDPPLS